MQASIFAFSLAKIPKIEFASGAIRQLPGLAAQFGCNILLITGGQSFARSAAYQPLMDGFKALALNVVQFAVRSEPSPELVDDAVKQFRSADIDVVVAIGGGSAMDTAKAIAGLLRVGHSVMDYLEGVGPERPYQGPAVPFIAVPTTAGTGSEATKNAVLSRHGLQGFKKSFRDEQLVADIALLDPDLLASCPPRVIAANGMDALTQLLESYVSIKNNVLNNALGRSGLLACREGLLKLYDSQAQDALAREQMAFASLASGINLAQTGLGSVHGLASPLGAYYPIPHGVVCGTLVATATRINIEAMRQREPFNPALSLYAEVAQLLCGQHFKSLDNGLQALIDLLEQWTAHLQIARLSDYGVRAEDFELIVANSRGSSMKTNPIVLTDDEILSILQERF